MTRVLELLVSLLIVAVLIVVVGVLLPSHGHVERSVEVSSPLRQIYDSVNTLRRFPEWSPERRLDPQLHMEYSGPRTGVGASVNYSGNETVGKGSLTIAASDEDSQVKMDITNDFAGENKTYTITLKPSESGKTTRINWAYDVDYGWNLMWRYAGLYIHGKPDATIQTAVANMANMLASFPNVDYKDQDIQVAEVTGVPVLVLSTKAPRTLDEVAEATSQAVARIEAVMKKAGLNQAGPVRTVTTNWGDDNYVFDVSIPVDSTTFTLDGNTYEITVPAVSDLVDDVTTEDAPRELKTGDHDEDGYLIIEDGVRAKISYSGLALVTEYTGSPAALPLLRLQEKAFAETHGYLYSEMNGGRFWDEATATDEDGTQTFKVTLPVEP
ncbi:SRPBCC family protein [Dokdonella immobilis]|uniref:Polyketide cyclase / dehydrase and lipid transport n=1 Tax=Dokdonella immobilis TaxID=578942 RepID=A0A1I5A4T7_9GAMM|nr:SRPBCC family protein [Dokdonella immobilis]SFN57340.1 Polyketide cyclase / dehydrase and lipid transport [Dokdonella immobilis]